MSSATMVAPATNELGNANVQLVTFIVGEVTFGIDINHVQEINRSLDVTEVPDAPDRFHGVVNLRGDVVTVINPNHVFGITPSQPRDSQRNLIINIDGERIGILVDKILDILEVQQSKLSRRPANVNSIDRKYIDSVYVREDQVVVVINASAFAANSETQTEYSQ